MIVSHFESDTLVMRSLVSKTKLRLNNFGDCVVEHYERGTEWRCKSVPLVKPRGEYSLVELYDMLNEHDPA